MRVLCSDNARKLHTPPTAAVQQFGEQGFHTRGRAEIQLRVAEAFTGAVERMEYSSEGGLYVWYTAEGFNRSREKAFTNRQPAWQEEVLALIDVQMQQQQ